MAAGLGAALARGYALLWVARRHAPAYSAPASGSPQRLPRRHLPVPSRGYEYQYLLVKPAPVGPGAMADRRRLAVAVVGTA